MPNKKEHLEFSATTVATISALQSAKLEFEKKNLDSNYKINYLKVFLDLVKGAGIGAFFGILPDILEPATNPHHRGFFHSAAFIGVLIYGYYQFSKSDFNPEFKKYLRLAIIGYLGHLGLDSTTPYGLPII